MLLGLKDCDDRIVAATFNALAVLVHILGGSVVVGGERRKNFSEGRPKVRDDQVCEVPLLRSVKLIVCDSDWLKDTCSKAQFL